MLRVPSFSYAPLLVALSMMLLGFRCGEGTTPAPAAVAPKPRPDLRLMLLTDPRGYLEPCGCQQRPLGGVDKLAASAAAARADGVPLLIFAAGDLAFGTVLHGDDALSARTQELLRAEALVDAWNATGLSAVTPGVLDFGMGLDVQRELQKRASFPWLAANLSVRDAAIDSATKTRLFEVSGHKVGVVGLMAPTPRLDAGLTVEPDLRGIASRAVSSLRGQGAELVLALVSGDRRAARLVAGSGADFVLMGGLDQEEPLAPSQHGGATLLHAGRQGQRVLTLELALGGQGAFHDESLWSIEVARNAHTARIEELKAHLLDWQKDPRTRPEELATQRARLGKLMNERGSVRQPNYKGRWFSAAILELSPDITGDRAIAARMDALDKRVNEHNRDALKDRLPKPPAEGAAAYAGSETCKPCHAAAYDWWRSTKHGKAYATLERVHKQYSLACVGCHVTGYNAPGGSTVTHVDGLKDVGCEACHGPASLHNIDPKREGQVQRDTSAATCLGCHNVEHSARFKYDPFRSLLVVPGHGLPAARSQGSP